MRKSFSRRFRKKDAAKLKSDPAFAALREHAEFQKLLAELETKRLETKGK